MTRSRRPVTGQCEAGAGVDYSGSAPLILLCRKPGVGRFDVSSLGIETILCDDCYKIIKDKQR